MARKTNVTGIKMLSIGTTKNDKGGVLCRYSVNYKVDNKNKCKSFYFGSNTSQYEAFIKACDFLESININIENAREIYKKFKHEELI